MDAELASQIQALVEQELARIGTRAVLRLDIERGELALGHGPAEQRVEIRGTLAQWESLPDDLRDRRIAQIAALLTADSRAPLPGRSPAAQPIAPARPPSRALGLR